MINQNVPQVALGLTRNGHIGPPVPRMGCGVIENDWTRRGLSPQAANRSQSSDLYGGPSGGRHLRRRGLGRRHPQFFDQLSDRRRSRSLDHEAEGHDQLEPRPARVSRDESVADMRKPHGASGRGLSALGQTRPRGGRPGAERPKQHRRSIPAHFTHLIASLNSSTLIRPTN